jgi:hypothetical protein
MELREFVAQSNEIVNELSRTIENREIGLKEVEERILQFINRIGDLISIEEATATIHIRRILAQSSGQDDPHLPS